MSGKQDPRLLAKTWQENYDGYYADGASEWRRLGATHKVDNIILMCSSVSHSDIVDIGAGEGAVSAELLRRQFCSSITCLEISESGVDAIRKRNLPSIKEVLKFDGYRTPYPNEHFDLAILSHVLEHVEHQRMLIYEAKRIAKHLFVEVPLEDTIRLPQDYELDTVGHINFYNYKTARRLLQTCGLEVLDQRLFNVSLDVLTFKAKTAGTGKFLVRSIANALSPSLASRVFTYHCGMLCRSSRRSPL